jgi:hypothetical protein
MGSLYHCDDDDDRLGPDPEEIYAMNQRIHAQNEAERIAETYTVIIGEVSFEYRVREMRSYPNGTAYVGLPIADLPDACIPADISRESLERYIWKSQKGKIEGSFFQEEGKRLVASPESFLNRLNYYCEIVRKGHKILIDGEEYHFPVIHISTPIATAQALVNGEVFPLRRDMAMKCWILQS